MYHVFYDIIAVKYFFPQRETTANICSLAPIVAKYFFSASTGSILSSSTTGTNICSSTATTEKPNSLVVTTVNPYLFSCHNSTQLL